ncbi:MAG: hypothetical protein Q8K85_01085 [Hyphomicrobium sp.]|nr:hypothetical protein [Hyphomicrobium sp.]
MTASVLLGFCDQFGKGAIGGQAEHAGGFAGQRPCHERQDVDRAKAHLRGKEPGDPDTMVVGGGGAAAEGGGEALGGELIVKSGRLYT